jgi:hypothetical protein
VLQPSKTRIFISIKRKKKMYLKEALDSKKFHRMRKVTI